MIKFWIAFDQQQYMHQPLILRKKQCSFLMVSQVTIENSSNMHIFPQYFDCIDSTMNHDESR